jgi:septal ring factor EnvC (AmiA/AmiB activator)
MDLRLSLSNTEMQMAKRLVVLYKYARKGYIKALANVTDLDQFWQRVKYLKAIMQEDRNTLVRLDEEVHSYKEGISRTKGQLVEKEAINNEKRMQLSGLRKDLEKKVIRLMKVHKEKEFYQTAVMELQLAAVNLKQTLLNIEKKESYRLTGFRFGDSKGRLYLPLEGKVVKSEGLLGSERGNSHKGIFIESSTDTRVKAVFPGRIDFSGRLKGYGEVIIINHGSRFFTISARLYQRKKEEGDLVEGREVIGLVGDNRLSKGSRLYFEIRRGEKNLDPFEWLKVR